MDYSTADAEFPALAPNASVLPYAARYQGWPLAWRVLGYGLVVAGMALLAYVLVRSPDTAGEPVPLLFCGALALLFAFQLWRLRKPQLILYPDRLEKPGLFQPSVLHRVNVKGVGKTIYTRNGSYFVVASKSEAEPSLRLDGALRKNPVVAEWLSGAKDPKAEALKAERATILADARYGDTEAERTRRLERTKLWTMAFNIACLALAAWIGFFAPLSSTTLLAALAPVGVAAVLTQMSDGLVVWFGRPGRPRIVGALAPAAALAAHAGLTIHMLRPGPFVWVAILLGVATAAQRYTTQATDASRVRSAIGFGIVAALAAYGLGVALDVCLDRSPPRRFVATVANERVSHGRSTNYYLDLDPWSDQPSTEVAVSSAFYDDTPIGSQVCLVRRAGGLGLGWFDVTRCPANTIPAAAAPPPGVTNPDWISQPTGAELTALYPDKAERAGVEGSATVHCTVKVDSELADCTVIQEQPLGYGFGAATLMAAGRFHLRPATRNGVPVEGEVTIPLRWRLH